MDDSYGREMERALRAVLQMHADSSRLLRDLDGFLPDYRSPFTNAVATVGQTGSVNSSRFMAQGLFRLYVKNFEDDTAIGVNVCFFDDEHRPPAFEEPLFVVAKITYRSAVSKSGGEYYWHPRTAFIKWSARSSFNEVVDILPEVVPPSVITAKVNAVPLFQIKDLESAQNLLLTVAPELARVKRSSNTIR